MSHRIEKKGNCVSMSSNFEKWNVGDRLKRVFPKFEAERSHPRGVNGRSKFCKKKKQLMSSASKHEMSGIVWNASSQSLRPNGAMFEGEQPFNLPSIFQWRFNYFADLNLLIPHIFACTDNKISKNRKLLIDFFASAAGLLCPPKDCFRL